ncbi:MAG: poly(ADP-ribose) polymerase family protein [Acidimicrobiales bacterium]
MERKLFQNEQELSFLRQSKSKGFYWRVYLFTDEIVDQLKFKDMKTTIHNLMSEKMLMSPRNFTTNQIGVAYVDVTSSVGKYFQDLIDNTTIKSRLGQGKDQKFPGNYGRLLVRQVHRVENRLLFTRYAVQREMIKSKGNVKTIPDVAALKASPQWISQQYLDSSVNEVFLFHGSKAEVVEPIAKEGFNERLSGDGQFGYGVYLAEHSSKSDQYCVPVPGSGPNTPVKEYRFQMFLVRACLGNVHTVTSSQNGTRIPPLIGKSKQRHDSLLATVGYQYPERVVYDGSQCYPEFIIEYARV